MTATNFELSLALVLVHEGGYVDHPKDPGGATNLGITIATLSAWRHKAVTKADVKALTRNEAAAIYRANYWDKVHGDELPTGLDYAVFDFAVNSGMGRATPYLQNSLGVESDGKIGQTTLEAARTAKAASVIHDLCDRRIAYLKRLKTFSTFGKGWTRRIAGVRSEALKMAASEPVQAVWPKPEPTPVQPTKPTVGPRPAHDDDTSVYPKATPTQPPLSVSVGIGTLLIAIAGAVGAFWGNIVAWVSHLFGGG